MDINIYTILLTRLYGDVIAKEAIIRLIDIIERHQNKIADRLFSFDLSRDGCNPVLLITYPDQVQTFNQPHLKTLSAFCKEHFQNIVSGIHILPFFLWSSDDGFSVMNYRKVDPSYGNWDDIEAIGTSFDLMIDSVLNHASAQGDWFQAFIQNEVPYNNYFVTIEGNPDLSKVVRPRTSPLLTTVQTRSGLKKVWTTFGSDQVDLDYKNPEVLLEMIDIILLYISHGARYLRLDAIAYLWKVIGTSCIHLPQTHTVVQLLRSILNDVAPDVKIITETNVPHHENISYFGNGTNEAHLVYNFALPPLVLHTLLTGDATALSEWAANLELPSRETTFLIFLLLMMESD
jgi:sucrose phosphorylase